MSLWKKNLLSRKDDADGGKYINLRLTDEKPLLNADASVPTKATSIFISVCVRARIQRAVGRLEVAGRKADKNLNLNLFVCLFVVFRFLPPWSQSPSRSTGMLPLLGTQSPPDTLPKRNRVQGTSQAHPLRGQTCPSIIPTPVTSSQAQEWLLCSCWPFWKVSCFRESRKATALSFPCGLKYEQFSYLNYVNCRTICSFSKSEQ